MTIDDPVQTSQLLLKKQPLFYNAKIPWKHWQLRSLLCSPAPDVLCYPSNDRIYSLNTATRKRKLIATLPFSPRCIGARYGWVCAGGAERGHFATIRLRKDHEYAARSDPMMLDGEDGDDSSRYIVNVKELGGYIMNSVTLHRPPSSTSDDDVLAVLTNNDKTVRIFHLAENRVVTTLHVDVSTNHASISPNGQHLVVVGDSPKVYFYHPASSTGLCSGSPGTGIGEAGCASWILSSHPPLSVGSDNDALMSTSFSASSLHCAIASQAGIITIFDTRYLSRNDGCSPLVKVIGSSRAYSDAGAVRSVQFSPAPWDLLVWAEHAGRVCIADARSNFTRRQVVEVHVDKDELIEVEVEDINQSPSAWDISQSFLGNNLISRRYPRDDDTINRRYFWDDEENDEDLAMSAAERNASWNEFADLVLESSNEWIAARERNMPASYLAAHPDLGLGPHSQMLMTAQAGLSGSTPALLRDYRERQIERERARQRVYDPPRRRASIHPSYTDYSGAAPATAAPAVPTTRGEREPSRLSRESTVTPSMRPEQVSSFFAERRRQRRGGRFDVDPVNIPYPDTTRGVDITGCTLDPDGKKLYVATVSGVVEYSIDLHGRKVFPSICPR